MKIGVGGLWHLGVMYAVGLSELGHQVIAYDPDSLAIEGFQAGELRVFEPGLQEMMNRNVENRNLRFTDELTELANIELFVLTYDTPVDDQDIADVDYVISEFQRIAEKLGSEAHVMVASQLPVGSCEVIRGILDGLGNSGRITVQPENLRLGKAVDSFFHPERIVVGTSAGLPDGLILEVFKGIDAPIVWMHSKSAEVTKHALNAFLATSVTFMGELSEICEKVGADAKEVELGLKSDARIGLKAYLSPGLGFAGGTLARDVRILSNLQSTIRQDSTIFTSLLTSNRHNNGWISRSLDKIASEKIGLRICFWGVSYVENTDTLRRSEIYKEMQSLLADNAIVSYVENFVMKGGVDPLILCEENIQESLQGIDILVVNKKLRKYIEDLSLMALLDQAPFWILDPSRVLLERQPQLLQNPNYLTIGKG